MSELVVDICTVDSLQPHANADRLEIVQVRGWQCVVPKEQLSEGQGVVYFPPDTLLPKAWTEKFGVTKYCSERENDMMRIRKTRLRGEPSFGLIIDVPDELKNESIGTSVIEFFGAEKYEPPVLGQAGDAAGGAPEGFHKFTEIENIRNYPGILIPGEEVIATEKIHGTCSRIGAVDHEVWAASKRWPRKKPETPEDMARNFYWYPYTLEGLRDFLDSKAATEEAFMVFGEVYGRVQSLKYGLNVLAYRCFAMSKNGIYLDYDERMALCAAWDIPTVPIIYRGPFDSDKLFEMSNGKTTVADIEQIREGIVIQPVKERTHPKVGRVILKCVGTDYLMSKHPDKDTTDV